MTLFAMNNIDVRRATREALAWRGYSLLEAAAEIGCNMDDLEHGRVGLWKIMALTGASDEQMYNWGHR